MEVKLDPSVATIGTVSAAKPEKKKNVVVKVRPQSADERSLAKTVHEWNFNPVTLKHKFAQSEKADEVGKLKTILYSFRIKKD